MKFKPNQTKLVDLFLQGAMNLAKLPVIIKNRNYSKYCLTYIAILLGYEYVIKGVLTPIIGLCGLVGNICSIIVFRKPEMKSNTNFILMSKYNTHTF